MTLYNLTLLTNATTVGDIVTTANTYSGGTSGNSVLIGFLLIAVYCAVFFGLKQYSYKDAFTAAGAVSWLLSLYMLAIGRLNLLWPIGFAILMASGLALHFIMKD